MLVRCARRFLFFFLWLAILLTHFFVFILFVTHNYRWEMDDSVAREKVGCLLRDRLHSQYRSSSKAKMAKRRALKAVASSSDDVAVDEDDLDLLGGDSTSIKHRQTDNADVFAAWACGAGAAGGSSCNSNNNNVEQESMFPSSKKFSMDLFGKSSSAMMMARRKTGVADALSNSVDNSGGGSMMMMGGNGLLPTSSQVGNSNSSTDNLNPANNIASLVDQAFGILGRRQNPAASCSFQPLPIDFDSLHSSLSVNFQGDLPMFEGFGGLGNARQQQQHRLQDDFNSFMGEDLMNSMNAGASDFALVPLDDDIFDM
jgi:hypothetical protein